MIIRPYCLSKHQGVGKKWHRKRGSFHKGQMITTCQAVCWVLGTRRFSSNLPSGFVQQLFPHTYVADVNFQGKVLKMKIMSTFQHYLKYLYWLYPKKNFKCCPIFNEKRIVRGKSLYKQLRGGVGRAETGSGVFQRSLAGGHSLLIYKVAI